MSEGTVLAVLESTAGTAPSTPSVQRAPPAPQPSPVSGRNSKAAVAPSPAPALAEAVPASSRAVPRTLPTAALPPHEPGAPAGPLPHASPSVRRFARELGVPLDQVKGSGPKGRITQEDVQAFTKAVMKGEVSLKPGAGAKAAGGGEGLGLLPWPQVDFEKFGAGRARPTSGASAGSPRPTCIATG